METKNYTPVEVEIIVLHACDIVTFSPNADDDVTSDDIFG